MVKDKNPIITLALVIMIVVALGMGMKGCTNELEAQNKPPVISHELDSAADRFDLQYKVYTFEGCEYIVVAPGNSHFTWGSHKGNCKNPIHQTK